MRWSAYGPEADTERCPTYVRCERQSGLRRLLRISRRQLPSGAHASGLPDGQVSTRDARHVSSPAHKNIWLGRLVDTALLIPAVPPRIEGRIAIVTNVGCGMQWTRWQRKTGATDADGEVAWS